MSESVKREERREERELSSFCTASSEDEMRSDTFEVMRRRWIHRPGAYVVLMLLGPQNFEARRD